MSGAGPFSKETDVTAPVLEPLPQRNRLKDCSPMSDAPRSAPEGRTAPTFSGAGYTHATSLVLNLRRLDVRLVMGGLRVRLTKPATPPAVPMTSVKLISTMAGA